MISKNLSMDIKKCNSGRIFIFGGYVKMRESLCTQVIIWDSLILNHIYIGVIFPRYEGSCMVSRANWYKYTLGTIIIV